MKVLCTGGESTGTRLATRLLTEMGAEAIHRSFPHGGQWPNLSEIEFDAAVVMARIWEPTVKSQVKARHVAVEAKGWSNLQEAYPLILSQIGPRPWVLVTYEGLYQYPAMTIRSILASIEGLHWPSAEIVLELRDENRKYA